MRDFAPTPSDEPNGARRRGHGAPNPVEQLLGALGNCLAVGYAANATVAGIELRDLRIDVKGDVDLHTFLGLRRGPRGLRLHLGRGDASTPTRRASSSRSCTRKVVGSSPVGHTLQHAVPLDITLTH